MLALRLYGKNDIRLEDIPVPKINNKEILIKTDAAAICGTDVRMWQNGQEGIDEQHSLTLGHEFSGTIAEVGKEVFFYEKGMRIAVQPNIGCGICDRCVDGSFHLCDHYRAFGINMDGAFAEYIKIPSDAITKGNLMVLPDSVSPEAAAIAEPLSCAFNGLSKCFVKPGEKAMVVGAGPIGLCHSMLLHMVGADVLLNDLNAERLAYCKKLLPILETYSGDNLSKAVNEWTCGKGLDVAVTACPVPSVQAAMLPLMNYGGRVNFFGGIPKDKEIVPINTNLVHYRELFLTGSTRASISQFRKVMNLIEQKKVSVDALVTDRYEIKDIVTAFESAKQGKGMKHVIIF